jgi:MobA/VirD2-like, nuclease domain
MIIRILSSGGSFKGLATYLTHDPEAKSAERVGWAHTLNLAHDDALSAVDEMLWTARNAELLKQEAGIRAGGRATENPVKHLSLNWSPDDHPSRAHMIEATEDFLRHMKWQEHQALLVAHEDKAHPHVHVMLNVVHPETGLRLDDGFERRRAQAWALEYEREQGNIRCENRLKDERDREDGPTRPAWIAFQGAQKSFEENEKTLAAQRVNFEPDLENPETRQAREWKILKEIQRDERLGFFAEGREAFSDLRRSIYREVREEFRPQWGDYYAARKDGADPEALKEMKAALLAEQNAVLEERRDEACKALRESRNADYRELLDGQRELRTGLHARQAAGLDSLELMDLFRVQRPANDDSGRGTSERYGEHMQEETAEERSSFAGSRGGNMRPASAISSDIALGLGFGLLSFIAGLDGSAPAPKPKSAEPESSRDLFCGFRRSRPCIPI